MRKDDLMNNLASVEERVAAACKRAGRAEKITGKRRAVQCSEAVYGYA